MKIEKVKPTLNVLKEYKENPNIKRRKILKGGFEIKHYVYRLTFLNGSIPKYYIGKHSGKLDDLGKRYFTSSKIVYPLFKKNPEFFKIKIIKVFETCKEALAFESKCLNRVNACHNKLFFNQSNYSYYTRDRTSLVTVFDSELNCKRSISCEEFYSNKERYIAENKGLTIYRDPYGNIIHCDSNFAKENDLVGVNKGIIYAKNISNETVKLTKEEYYNNKDLYKVGTLGNVVCRDKVTGETKRVTKEEFCSNSNLVGVYNEYQSKFCPICGLEVSVQNFERHINKHKTRVLWVTDGIETWKCIEETYLLKYKDKFDIIQKNGDKTIGYINGEPYNIRYIGRVRKDNFLE